MTNMCAIGGELIGCGNPGPLITSDDQYLSAILSKRSGDAFADSSASPGDYDCSPCDGSEHVSSLPCPVKWISKAVFDDRTILAHIGIRRTTGTSLSKPTAYPRWVADQAILKPTLTLSRANCPRSLGAGTFSGMI
jgi:hypothetical protein